MYNEMYVNELMVLTSVQNEPKGAKPAKKRERVKELLKLL